MVALARGAFAACMLLACVGSAFADQVRSVSGAWSGVTSPGLEHPPYFVATLAQEGDALTGAGHSNRCPTCRGFDQYEVNWTGSVKGDWVLLIARHVDRPWESEQRYEGVLSADGQTITGAYHDGSSSERFVMRRQRDPE